MDNLGVYKAWHGLNQGGTLKQDLMLYCREIVTTDLTSLE